MTPSGVQHDHMVHCRGRRHLSTVGYTYEGGRRRWAQTGDANKLATRSTRSKRSLLNSSQTKWRQVHRQLRLGLHDDSGQPDRTHRNLNRATPLLMCAGTAEMGGPRTSPTSPKVLMSAWDQMNRQRWRRASQDRSEKPVRTKADLRLMRLIEILTNGLNSLTVLDYKPRARWPQCGML